MVLVRIITNSDKTEQIFVVETFIEPSNVVDKPSKVS